MWRLESHQARWHTQQFQFQVNLRQPQNGWGDVRLGDESLPDALFCLHLPGDAGDQSIIDSYVRQADLVVTYAQTSDRTVRPQVVWRVLRDGDTRVGAEAILSMQTSLLDSQPDASVSFRLGGELLKVTDSEAKAVGEETIHDHCLLLQRPASENWSLVVCLHPSDFLSLRCETGATNVATFALFPESLEKGVIRRARVRGIYVPRDGDVEFARKCGREMVEAAPPLTT